MLFEDTYLTLATPCEGIFKDKGSKFLAYAHPVLNEKEIREIILHLKKEHHSARHHCFAYRLGADKQIFRANDDGEPSNTAGKPILGQIQSKDLTNTLIVVVRYFGGTLLGVSGLINAYRKAAAEALNNATIVEKTVNDYYEVTFDYTAMNDVMKILKDEKADIVNQQFDLECKLSYSIRRANSLKTENALKNLEGIKIRYLQTG